MWTEADLALHPAMTVQRVMVEMGSPISAAHQGDMCYCSHFTDVRLGLNPVNASWG